MPVIDEYEYAATFAQLGRSLVEADGVSEDDIARAERRLGHGVPTSVRAFYRVAGRARDFVGHYDDFLLPDDWSVDGTKLIFLDENQGVVTYAVDVTAGSDPPVVMASNIEPFEWHPVCDHASTFCRAMLHWEASFGGAMAATGSAVVNEAFRSVLERECHALGEVNAMWAYGREGLAACFVRWDDGWRVFLGALDDEALDQAAERFGVDLDSRAE